MRYFPGYRIGRHAIAIVFVATQIAACGSVLDSLPGAGGGGKSGSTNLAPVQATGMVSGVAKDALIRNATVRIYAWNGAKGELLGSGTTDDRGKYAVPLQVRSQSVLLEVSGGVYTEEATLTDVSLATGQVLYAVRNYGSGESVTTAITYYTTLAVGLAEHLVSLGMKPSGAVEEANSRLAKILGFDTNTVVPTDILDPDSFALPGLQYGFATAALSSLTERASILNGAEPHTVFTSVKFIQAAYDDVRSDGVLNGRGVNGEVTFGSIRLNPDIYRHELALHILRIANNKVANRTGRSPMQMFDLAFRLNEADDPIFAGAPVIPIDSDKPNVSALAANEFPNLANNAVVFGGLNLSAMVTTFPGAATTQLVLDDQIIGMAADPENPSVRFETINPAITEGQHTLRFRVTDISGAVGESPLLVINVSNKQTAIENVSIVGQFVGKETLVTADIVDPAGPKKIEYAVRPQGADAFSPVATITVEGGVAMLQAAAQLDPRQLPIADGDAVLKVEVTNSVGFVFAKEVPFVIDRQSPTVAFTDPTNLASGDPNNQSGRYFDRFQGTPCTPLQPISPGDSCLFYARRPFEIGAQVTDNRAVDVATLSIDGRVAERSTAPAEPTTSAALTFMVDPRSVRSPAEDAADGQKTIVITALDKAHNAGMDGRQIVFDATPPTSSNFQITPVTGNNGSVVLSGTPVIVSGSVNIAAQVDDSFGVASALIVLNGVGISSPVVNQGNRVTVTAVNFDTTSGPDGLNTVSVFASDRAGNQLVSGADFQFEVDNIGPVIDLIGLRFVGDRCRLMGNASDQRLESVVFISPGGERFPLVVDAAGGFAANLGNDGAASVEATDSLGNKSTRTFNVNNAEVGEVSVFCEVSENGRRLFRIN